MTRMEDMIREIHFILTEEFPDRTFSAVYAKRKADEERRYRYWVQFDGLHMRAINCLVLRLKADSVEQVSSMTDEELLAARNLGHSTLALIRFVAPYKEVTDAN